jgi:hypothetical protein
MDVHRSLNMVVLRGACVQRNGIQLFAHGYRSAYQQAVGCIVRAHLWVNTGSMKVQQYTMGGMRAQR